MAIVVRTNQLTKDFRVGFWRPRPHRALDGISFEIGEGQVFGLLGPNGAGKSTTLKLLLDLLRPTSGVAELFGRPPRDTGARRRVGFLPENPTFYDHLTAEELLVYLAGLFGYDAGDRRARASRVLDLVGLGDDRRRPLRQFSKGMIQRVGLAQALVNDPELVILDEPMSGLDPLGRREVRAIILKLRDEGRTVLFSSHILTDAEQLCSHAAIIAKGRLAASGRISDLTGDATARAGSAWEIVAVGVTAAAAERIGARAMRVVLISDGRYSFELGAGTRPELFVAELAQIGATLVSVTPVRATLEDAFVAHVGAAPPRAGSGPA